MRPSLWVMSLDSLECCHGCFQGYFCLGKALKFLILRGGVLFDAVHCLVRLLNPKSLTEKGSKSWQILASKKRSQFKLGQVLGGVRGKRSGFLFNPPVGRARGYLGILVSH